MRPRAGGCGGPAAPDGTLEVIPMRGRAAAPLPPGRICPGAPYGVQTGVWYASKQLERRGSIGRLPCRERGAADPSRRGRDTEMANAITLARLALLFALVAMAYWAPPRWQLLDPPLLLLIISLDGLDGWVARRRGETSVFGAVFDIRSEEHTSELQSQMRT